MFDATTWYRFGHALGLSPCVAHEAFGIERSFDHLREVTSADDALGEEPSSQHWFHGYRDEIEAFVLPFTSASSEKSYVICVACAESDDPYATFMDLGRDTLVRYFSPEVDYANSMSLPFRDAARALGEDVLVGANESRAIVARHDENESLGTLRADLDIATDLARSVSKIESFVPREWGRFADAYALSYDDLAVRVQGAVHGCGVIVQLESRSTAPHIVTNVTIEFPTELPIQKATIEATNHPTFLQGVFGQDLELGVHSLDAKYRVRGTPSNEVCTLLRHPSWLTALQLPGLGRLELAPRYATFSFAGCPPRAKDLELLLACGSPAGTVGTLRPYR